MECLYVLRGHQDRVNSAALLNSAQLAVSGSDDWTVRIWNVAGERTIAVLRGHNGPVVSVDADIFGARAVSAGLDGTVRVWDLEQVLSGTNNAEDEK